MQGDGAGEGECEGCGVCHPPPLGLLGEAAPLLDLETHCGAVPDCPETAPTGTGAGSPGARGGLRPQAAASSAEASPPPRVHREVSRPIGLATAGYSVRLELRRGSVARDGAGDVGAPGGA